MKKGLSNKESPCISWHLREIPLLPEKCEVLKSFSQPDFPPGDVEEEMTKAEIKADSLPWPQPTRREEAGRAGEKLKPEITISVSSIWAQRSRGATEALIGLDLHSQHQLGRLGALREIPNNASFHPHDKQGTTGAWWSASGREREREGENIAKI